VAFAEERFGHTMHLKVFAMIASIQTRQFYIRMAILKAKMAMLK
jgi:hypothetical protein